MEIDYQKIGLTIMILTR